MEIEIVSGSKYFLFDYHVDVITVRAIEYIFQQFDVNFTLPNLCVPIHLTVEGFTRIVEVDQSDQPLEGVEILNYV